MSPLDELLGALERDTRTLGEALRRDDAAGWAEALARRGGVIAALERELARPGCDGGPAREAVARAVERDAELAAALCARRDAVRAALEEVRRARQVARGAGRAGAAGRFVCERI